MTQRKQGKRDKTEKPEEQGGHKRKTTQSLYDQSKTADEGVANLLAKTSVEDHATLLAEARSSEQRASLVTNLQKSYGNTYVQRLLSSMGVQAKLTVNPPDDEYEKEADRIANQVSQAPASEIQRQEEEEIQAKATQVQRQIEEEEEEPVQTRQSSEVQRQEELPEEELAMKATRVQHQVGPNVVQRGIWDKIMGLFGRKKRPEDVEIKKAEKRANALTKKHRKIVKKMAKLNDQHLHALEKGKFDKADAIFNKFEELSKEHDEVRDETDEAVTHYSQLVLEEGEKISELLSQDITGTREEDLKEADMELDKLSEEMGERKSTLATEEDEFQRILNSIEVTEEEIKAYMEKQKAKEGITEEDEFQQILNSIVVTQDELKAYMEKLRAKEAKETEQQLEEVKIPSTELPGTKKKEQEEAVLAKPASEIQRQPLALAEDLETQINTARGSGQPLNNSVRAYLEPQFGHDFGDVNVHTDAEANKLSQQLGAEAFTTGKDIFFRDGAYQPDSTGGKGLIAHEVTHVVQQEAAPALQRQDREEVGKGSAGRIATLIKAMGKGLLRFNHDN